MPDVIVAEPDRQLRLLSCALRNAGSGWGLISDAAHHPSGITGVVQRSDCLEIQHAVGAVAVSSMQVTVDEYFAARAMRCGVSVGLDFSRIFLYSGTSITPLAPASVVASSGNLWVTGFLELPAA
ncbi:hypothetical protein [Streptomyces sp. NPDC002913]